MEGQQNKGGKKNNNRNKNNNQAASQSQRPAQSAQGQRPAQSAKGQRPPAQQEERKGPAPQDSGWGAAMFSAKQNQGRPDNKPQGAAGFAARPTQSSHADRSAQGGRGRGGGGGGRGGFSAPQAARGSSSAVSVTSNHFKLNLGQNVFVYQYALRILPDDIFDASVVHDILATKHRRIYRILGSYAPSGQMIFTMNQISEDVHEETTFKGRDCQIIIEKNTETITRLDENFINSQTTVCQSVFNVILKNAFRQIPSLKQIGRDPRFFDFDHPIIDEKLTQMRLQVLHGFKATAFMSEVGVTVAVDTLFRFMSTITCLDKIRELRRQAQNDSHFTTLIESEVVGSSIIADWGHKRTYIIASVDFKTNPVKQKFEHNGAEVSVAEYMHRVYEKAITDLQQPLIVVKHGDSNIHLPPEFCRIDGVPDQIRASPGMRDCLALCRTQPDKKMEQVQRAISMLMQTQQLRDWNVSLESNPIDLRSQVVLGAPQIFKQKQVIHIDESVLRRLPIQRSVKLSHEDWIMIYQNPKQKGSRQRSNYVAANNIFESLVEAGRALNIEVEEPYWIELENEADMNRLEEELQYYISKSSQQMRFPKLVLMVLGNESLYDKHKQVYKLYQVPSQVVTSRNGMKFNLSKASNILKQINSKMGGDLFNLKFPDKMKNQKTMLIGIDVCHSGGNSIVGFAASTNPEMSQYYSDFIVQKKGQEVVNAQLKQCLGKAVEAFARNNKNTYPTDIIIFRDGVSQGERAQVINTEVAQFQDACQTMYNQASVQPKITLVIVNKRIIQSFFVKDGQGRLSNPPSGCLIDSQLVESTGSRTNEFDFFLFPVRGTQGCQKPTHFYVAMNQTNLTKLELQQLIFALCHYYFNWAGPIKVPAPCMYAHKIADLFTRIGYSKKARNLAAIKSLNQNQVADFIGTQARLETKLFFL